MDRIKNIIREELQKLDDANSYKNNYGLPEWFNLKHFSQEKEREANLAKSIFVKIEGELSNPYNSCEEKLTQIKILTGTWLKL